MENFSFFELLVGYLYLFSFPILIGLSVKKRKEIGSSLKKIPPFLLGANLIIYLTGIFLVPRNFNLRGSFSGILQMAKETIYWYEPIFIDRGGVFLFIVRVLSEIFDGIGYQFLTNLNFTLFIISSFLLSLFLINIIENKHIATFGALIYATLPITFYSAITDEFTVMAIFFTTLSLYFSSLFIQKKDHSFFMLTVFSAILASGSRMEYVFVPYIIIFCILLLTENKKKNFYKNLAIFILLALPRTISGLFSYLDKATYDANVFGTTYDKAIPPLTRFFHILGGNTSEFFLDNLSGKIRIFGEWTNLIIIVSFLALASLLTLITNTEKDKVKKVALFFTLYFIGVFFYYSFFHREGLEGGKYLPTALLPLTSLAGIGLFKIVKNKIKLGYLVLTLIFSYTVIFILIPLRSDQEVFYPTPDTGRIIGSVSPVEEFKAFNKLSYGNRIFKLFNPGKNADVESGENVFFIANGDSPTIYAMPINSYVHGIANRNDFNSFYNSIPEGSVVYASQGANGPLYPMDGEFVGMHPDEFPQILSDYFKIEEKIFSFDYMAEEPEHLRGHKKQIEEENREPVKIFLYKLEK